MGKTKIAITVDEHRSRLATECAKLDKAEEQALADEGYVEESEWPEY